MERHLSELFVGHALNFSEESGSSFLFKEVQDLLGQHVNGYAKIGVYTANKSIGASAILGVLAARDVAVPLDYHSPIERIGQIVKDVMPAAILCDEISLDSLYSLVQELGAFSILAHGPVRLVVLENQSSEFKCPPDLAYILYTSGSTGIPKGVMISHENALTFVNWAFETFSFSESDVFSSIAPLHFDLSIFDLFVSFKSKAERRFYEPNISKNPMLLAARLAEEKVTVLYATPTVLSLLLNFGKLNKYNFKHLRYVFFAGEVFPYADLVKLTELWEWVTFVNFYGPTETNVCTYYQLPVNALEYPVPIGIDCLPNTTQIVGGKEEGELMVTGKGVSPGYWNSKVLNDQKYWTDEHGVSWYLTGDLVRKQKGHYIFLGRNDRMIKRRGYRIELDEVAQTLSSHPNIILAATLAVNSQNKPTRMVAFYQLKTSNEISQIDLRAFFLQKLPLYMVPDELKEVAEIPKTSTQKIDYKALKALLND